MIVVQIGCFERMRELTMGMIEYALDRNEFHSFEYALYEVHRSDAEKEAATAYVDEVAEHLHNRKQWAGFGK
jgi:hypothetical protein